MKPLLSPPLYHKSDYYELLSDLYLSYQHAYRHQPNGASRLKFELINEESLVDLATEILERRYEIRPCNCFLTHSPVLREIIAADFRDRIVHHYIYDYLYPVVEDLLIYDCYSCRSGRGTHFGVCRLSHHIRSISENYTKPCYVLQLDIEGYFMHINRILLYQKTMAIMDSIKQKYGEYRYFSWSRHSHIRYLLGKIIFNNPLENCTYRTPLRYWQALPKSKSLKYSPPDCGLPIGNLTSQLFSNIYLNDFDHYIKRECKIKGYGRYVDDFYLIDSDRDRLLSLIPSIKEYLLREFGLTLHPRKIRLQEVRRGVTFLGYHLKPFRCHLSNSCRRRVKKGLKGVMYAYIKGLTSPIIKDGESHLGSFDLDSLLVLHSRISSYSAHLQWANDDTLFAPAGSLFLQMIYKKEILKLKRKILYKEKSKTKGLPLGEE